MKAGVDAPEPALEQGGEGSGVASERGEEAGLADLGLRLDEANPRQPSLPRPRRLRPRLA